jgi:hypothetical protein
MAIKKSVRDLKQRIIDEMYTDESGVLERCFDQAKEFVQITREGGIVLAHKDRLTGKEQIMLYLIGKVYAKTAGKATGDDVGNEELATELGIPMGSLRPWLKALRDANMVKSIRKNRHTNHAVQLNVVERFLLSAIKKLRDTKEKKP